MARTDLQDVQYFSDLFSSPLWPYIVSFNAAVGETDDARNAGAKEEAQEVKVLFHSCCSDLPDSLRTTDSERATTFFWDFSEESRILTLLPDELLRRLATVAGVTLHARDLAMIVGREARVALEGAIGSELLRYALMRGQYQAGRGAGIFSSLDRDKPLPFKIRIHGWLALLLVAEFWPMALFVRFRSRLNSLVATVSSGDQTLEGGDAMDVQKCLSARPFRLREDVRQALWRMLKRCLLKEVAPEWAHCFTP